MDLNAVREYRKVESAARDTSHLQFKENLFGPLPWDIFRSTRHRRVHTFSKCRVTHSWAVERWNAQRAFSVRAAWMESTRGVNRIRATGLLNGMLCPGSEEYVKVGSGACDASHHLFCRQLGILFLVGSIWFMWCHCVECVK